jgi:hypothetical protein
VTGEDFFLISIIHALTCFGLQRDTFTSIQSEATVTVHVLKVKIYTYNINNIELAVKAKVFTTTAAVPSSYFSILARWNDVDCYDSLEDRVASLQCFGYFDES